MYIPLIILAVLLLAPTAQAGPVTVETKSLSSPVADPFVGFVSVGPKHEYDPVYHVPKPGACSILVYRVLIQRYAHFATPIRLPADGS